MRSRICILTLTMLVGACSAPIAVSSPEKIDNSISLGMNRAAALLVAVEKPEQDVQPDASFYLAEYACRSTVYAVARSMSTEVDWSGWLQLAAKNYQQELRSEDAWIQLAVIGNLSELDRIDARVVANRISSSLPIVNSLLALYRCEDSDSTSRQLTWDIYKQHLIECLDTELAATSISFVPFSYASTACDYVNSHDTMFDGHATTNWHESGDYLRGIVGCKVFQRSSIESPRPSHRGGD